MLPAHPCPQGDFYTFASTGDANGALSGLFVGNDIFTGSTGADVLLSFAGNDTLTGGAGLDTLIGGAGGTAALQFAVLSGTPHPGLSATDILIVT